MSGVWVDTDFGFDDLWALLLLRFLRIEVAGVSLVSGNTPLPQVCRNASSAKQVFAFNWPFHCGAAKPLQRTNETAEHVLGATGMQSRGKQLPPHPDGSETQGAIEALSYWLQQPGVHNLLALGPLTNIALLCQQSVDIARQVDQLTWLGGSAGRGNQTPLAEYNAVADAAALERVIASGIRLDIIDLELCRRVSFSGSQIPVIGSDKPTGKEQLLRDLLGGYLDIALTRGRHSMAIYDPLAALACARPALFNFEATHVRVHTTDDASYGRTEFSSLAAPNARLASSIDADAARRICMDALTAAASGGTNQQGSRYV